MAGYAAAVNRYSVIFELASTTRYALTMAVFASLNPLDWFFGFPEAPLRIILYDCELFMLLSLPGAVNRPLPVSPIFQYVSK